MSRFFYNLSFDTMSFDSMASDPMTFDPMAFDPMSVNHEKKFGRAVWPSLRNIHMNVFFCIFFRPIVKYIYQFCFYTLGCFDGFPR